MKEVYNNYEKFYNKIYSDFDLNYINDYYNKFYNDFIQCIIPDKINYLCSLGPQSGANAFITQQKLRMCAFPFDNIFSSPKMITHCMNNNFKDFLNKNLYVKHPNKSIKITGHTLYNSRNYNASNLFLFIMIYLMMIYIIVLLEELKDLKIYLNLKIKNYLFRHI